MSKYCSKLLRPSCFLWFFIFVGAALRIGSMWGPLTYDELSAICRLDYHSVADLMNHAVRLADVHPGGVQLFLWLWCGLFGTAGWVVRIPFIFMGIASIPLIYIVGKRWFGSWPALLPTAVVALSQYTVYYSVMARPYAPGLFLMLCALLCWTRIILEKDYRFYLFALFAFCEALCAYTHYFSLLSATLLALGGFFFIDRRHLLHYLGACLAAVLLFLPHISITCYQLFEYKGIGGWLGKPTLAFLPDYLRYLAHHSLPMGVVAFVVWMLSFSLTDTCRNRRLIVFSLVVWTLLLVVGYLYSVLVNPLLQFSSLIFVFPFLLLALAGTVASEPPQGRCALLLVVFTVAMLLSLVLTRKHFRMMQQEWIEVAADEATDAIERYGAEDVTCLFDVAINKLHYYDSSLYSLPRSFLGDLHSLDSLLACCSTNYFLCAGIHEPRVLDVITSHYPYLLRKRLCVSTEVLLFGREPVADTLPLGSGSFFSKHIALPQISSEEFYDLFDTTLADITESRFVCINSSLSFLLLDSCTSSLRLVTETYIGRRRVDWREANAASYCRRQGDTCVLNLPVRLEMPVKHRSQLHRTRVKVYLWNPDGDTLARPLGCGIYLFRGNPYIYSVLEEL